MGTVSFKQSLLILTSGIAILGGLSPSARAATPKSRIKTPTTARSQHARELLGSTYRKSAAKRTEGVRDIAGFIRQSVETQLPSKFKSKAPQITRAILAEANRHGFDPIFIMAVIQTESSFVPNQVGGVGEIGLMQIRPTTAKWLNDKLGNKAQLGYRNEKSLYNVETNIRIGTAYFAMLREKFDASSPLYLAAYNMGATNVKRSLRNSVMPREYAGRIMKRYIQFYEKLENQVALEQQALKQPQMVASR
jgi:soluble lytic murein transglycosylase